MTRSALVFVLSTVCTFVIACSTPPPVVTDAGNAADAGTDGGADTGAPGALFAHCTDNAECASGDCRTAFPGGLCTMACTTDTDCGSGGACSGSNVCLPACHSGDGTCAPTGACVTSAGGTGFCTSACWPEDRRPAEWTPCNPGLVCNDLRSRCIAPSMLPTTGAANGGPCTSNADCLSDFCLLEVSGGVATGYVGGMCAGAGLVPPDSEFVAGSPLPRSNCVAGSVVLPSTGGRPGDFTLCFDDCATDADCRGGYECGRGPSGEYATGACIPLICDVPGATCPTGYACQTIGGLSRCVAM
jgi:hypothetical protein